MTPKVVPTESSSCLQQPTATSENASIQADLTVVAVAVTPDVQHQQQQRQEKQGAEAISGRSDSSITPLSSTATVTTIKSIKNGTETNNIQPKQLTAAQHSMVLAHRIKSGQIRSVENAVNILQEHGQPSQQQSMDWEEAWYETLQLCGKAKNVDTAFWIAQDCLPTSDRCRALAIAIAGRNQDMTSVLQLVKNNATTIATPAPYHAAMAACGTNRAWQEALDMAQQQMPPHMISTTTCNTVLMALAKAKRGDEALIFLQNFPSSVQPDRTSYHKVIAALIGAQQLDAVIDLVWNTMRKNTNEHVRPNQETLDRIISAIVGRVGRPKEQDESPEQRDHYQRILQQLDQLQQQATKLRKRKRSSDTNTVDETPTARCSKAFKIEAKDCSAGNEDGQQLPSSATGQSGSFQKWLLPKVGKCKTAYWELGTLAMDTRIIEDDDNDGIVKIANNKKSHIVVGLHPNRNPAKNGIQLWFFREEEDHYVHTSSVHGSSPKKRRQKLGYLLMINSPDNKGGHGSYQSTATMDINNNHQVATNGTSQFLGLKVMDNARNQGLAKVFVAVWLQCCMDGDIQPVTGRMNKPLLCLVLQHTFGFLDKAGSGGATARLLPSSCWPAEEEISPQTVVLTPASLAVKNLAGVFTPRDLKEQQIKLLPPSSVPSSSTKGRVIVVGGTLMAPQSQDEIQKSIDVVLQQKWQLSPEMGTGTAKKELMSRLFLGV